jgi:hypothetical protein
MSISPGVPHLLSCWLAAILPAAMRPMPCVLLWQQARTAMHMAAIHSRMLILEDLLAAGADPDARDKVASQFVPHLVTSLPRYLYLSHSSL